MMMMENDGKIGPRRLQQHPGNGVDGRPGVVVRIPNRQTRVTLGRRLRDTNSVRRK